MKDIIANMKLVESIQSISENEEQTAEELYRKSYKAKKPLTDSEEAIIAKSAEYSYHYAKAVLRGRFELAEPTIAKDPTFSMAYIKDVLGSK